MKNKILELIELKVEIILAEKEHKKEIDACDDYRYNEGYESEAMRKIARLEKQINNIEL